MLEPDRWLIVSACQQAVVRAAAAVDAGDATALANLFTADAILERPNAAPLIGRDAIRLAYAARPVERMTRHLVTNTLVDILAPDRSHASSLVLLWTGNRKDAPGAHGRPADARQLVGEFEDDLVATDEGWRIARRRAVFVLYTDA